MGRISTKGISSTRSVAASCMVIMTFDSQLSKPAIDTTCCSGSTTDEATTLTGAGSATEGATTLAGGDRDCGGGALSFRPAALSETAGDARLDALESLCGAGGCSSLSRMLGLEVPGTASADFEFNRLLLALAPARVGADVATAFDMGVEGADAPDSLSSHSIALSTELQ